MRKPKVSIKTVYALGMIAALFITSTIMSGCTDSGLLADRSLSIGELPDQSEGSSVIPQDSVFDTGRSAQDFSFESYVTVGLDLSLSIIDEEGEYLPGDDNIVIVTVTTLQDNELFRGMAAPDGKVQGFFGVPTSIDSILLSIAGPGLDGRVLTIDNPAALSVIKRDLQVVSLLTGRTLSAALVDSDGDGVPDIYDAFPADPTVAFEIAFPGDGSNVFTVAYEDNFPNLGDGDYNDFVANYSVSARGLSNKLFLLSGTATALAKVAGYDHEFGLVFRIPGASGTLSTTLNGSPVIQNLAVADEIQIPLFASTSEATSDGYSTASFTIIFSTNPGVPLTDLPPAPFDPYLYIKNTDYDVHLIGESPLPGSQLSSDEDYRDADGFPRALLVPGDFAAPQEMTSILDAYPRFQAWVDAEGGIDPDGLITSDWYFYPDSTLTMDISS
ncbi:LruC domain-containing protein [Oceanispirochaeta crateris]|uniref:LruC domain-containing protein n=1 Tax=Oceanispirochaeta crateris TaxID=2518645 RepID=A0A5C1QRY9_9SPIO|nr:LruC domain-containing protein [Oceanispirochaeta crateris]QEN09326.1 LruC domain-containing protein [Oceanispirochaeta crateris]